MFTRRALQLYVELVISSATDEGELVEASALRVVARIRARPETVDEVRALLCSLVGPTRKEYGCISYDLLQNREDQTDFTFVEEWESEAAFESHAASDHIKAIGPKLKSVVAEAPEIRTYSVVS